MVEWANTSHVFVLDTLEDLGGGLWGVQGHYWGGGWGGCLGQNYRNEFNHSANFTLVCAFQIGAFCYIVRRFP